MGIVVRICELGRRAKRSLFNLFSSVQLDTMGGVVVCRAARPSKGKKDEGDDGSNGEGDSISSCSILERV